MTSAAQRLRSAGPVPPLFRVRTALRLAPRNAVIAVLIGYRAVISPLYGDVCRYHPSCSRYALEAVQGSGVTVGTALSIWRVLRCNPWSRGGVDDPRRARPDTAFRITPLGFVRPAEQPGD